MAGKPIRFEQVSLENNELFQEQDDVKVKVGEVIFPPAPPPGGKQNLIYDETYGSYYSVASTAKLHPGQFNVGIGAGTFENATEGSAHYNIHIGQRAGWKTTVGKNNVFIGWEAGRENSFGNDNVGISEDALRDNVRGAGNVAIGRGAMLANVSGAKNTAVGYNSLQASLAGEGNTGVGPYSLAWLVKGSNNVGIGPYALESNGSENVVINNAIGIGNQAGLSNLHSDVILIGTKAETDKAGGINIGGVYKGNLLTGEAEVQKMSIGGRKITFDDDFMYINNAGVVKKIALQDL